MAKPFLIILLCLVSFVAFPDPPCPPGPDGLPDCGDNDPSIPFDGGATLLIAAGVGLAGKKAMDYRKLNKK